MTEESMVLTLDSVTVEEGAAEPNYIGPLDKIVMQREAENPPTSDEPLGAGYRIADAHAHIYPSKIAEKATKSVGDFYLVEMTVREGLPGALIAKGKKIGCERFLVCSVATKPEQVKSITEYIAGECAKHPEFVGLGAYHQDIKDPVPVLDHIQSLGLHGVKVHSDFQHFNIDDPALMPLYRECEKRGLPILFHTGDDRYDYSSPVRLARVIDKVPDLKCIAAHFGGYKSWEKVPVLRGSGVYCDTSSSLWGLTPEQVLDLIDIFGIDHVMFGDDFPMWDLEHELKRLLAIGLSHEDNQKILYDNFAGFFGLD